MRKSIRDARARLQQFGSELGSLIATRKSSTYVDPVTGKTPAQLRGEQDKVLRDRREGELKAARDTAATAEDRDRAQRDLDDFYTEERIANAERAAEDSGANAEKSVDNLVAQFNRGSISADQFRTELSNLIGAPLGDELGAAFSSAFSAALSNITAQVDALNVGRYGGERGVGDSGVVNPQDVADEEAATASAEAKERALKKARKQVKDEDAHLFPAEKTPTTEQLKKKIEDWEAKITNADAEWRNKDENKSVSLGACGGGWPPRRKAIPHLFFL